MYSHPQQGMDRNEVLKSRQEAGRYVKSLREAAGLSQRELAKVVGIDYYTFISQIESGRGRIPPLQMKAFAKAFEVSEREFAITLMQYYDPISYEMIFGSVSAAKGIVSADRDDLMARLARLEEIVANRG